MSTTSDALILVETVEASLADSGLAHERLVLEFTETALAHDGPGALTRLFGLRRRGVCVAIDDFGTGYSSLSRLRELPFDILKINHTSKTRQRTRTPPVASTVDARRRLDTREDGRPRAPTCRGH